ncbi:MAG: helix-turn-helix domain-containing protein [Rubrivivax sp.]
MNLDSTPAGSIEPGRAAGALAVDGPLGARLVSVSWLTIAASERVVIVPAELFRLSAFVSTTTSGEPLVELSVAGLQTAPAAFTTPGDGCMVVALLTALGIAELLGTPMSAITDRRILLEDLCTWDELQPLADGLRAVEGGEAAAHVMQAWIRARMQARRPLSGAPARAAEAAAALAGTEPDAGSVERLAQRLGVSRRQLERDFVHWVGVQPGAYVRLARVQRAAQDLAEGQAAVAAAFDNGYADQPHLTRTTRAMTLLTPATLRTHGMRPEASTLRRLLADRLLFLRMPDEAVESGRVESLPTGCPLTRFIRSVGDARRAALRNAGDRTPKIAR